MNIFLIGYRCTGKTSVGRCIAEKIGWNFIDADELLMQNFGETVSDIVSRGGWSLFREFERDTLKTICLKRRQVIATGGGVVTNEENINLMKQHGIVVWLRATPETILDRMLQDRHTKNQRPSLTDRSLKIEIQETLKERTPLYQSTMTIDVDTERKSPAEVSLEIVSLLEKKTFYNA